MHPLGGGLPLVEAIRQERRELEPLRGLADQIVDTSLMRIRDLRERMVAIAREVRSDGNLIVTIFSFGFKYGIPAEADLVFDVRFIRNPFFEEGLKHLSGLDDPVRDFVLGRPETAAVSGRRSCRFSPSWCRSTAPTAGRTSPSRSAAPAGGIARRSSPGPPRRRSPGRSCASPCATGTSRAKSVRRRREGGLR